MCWQGHSVPDVRRWHGKAHAPCRQVVRVYSRGVISYSDEHLDAKRGTCRVHRRAMLVERNCSAAVISVPPGVRLIGCTIGRDSASAHA